MKWNKQWLLKQKDGEFDFEESLTFPKEMFYNLSRINGLKDVVASGHGKYDLKKDRLYVDLNIKGTMIVPCAISLEDVDYPFEIHQPEIFAFYKPDDDEDVVEARKDVADMTSLIWTEIMMEVPMRVVKPGAKMKRSGEGWQVIDESELETDEIDPRLAKLKDYFKDK